MKLRIIMEIEVSDLPDEEREELMDGLNFRHDLDETLNIDLDLVPKLEGYSTVEVEEAVVGYFHEQNGQYDMQRENWAGSEFYGWISKFDILTIGPVPTDRAYRMLEAAAKDNLTITVYDDIAKPDYVGKSPADAWEHVTATDEVNVILTDTAGKRVGWVFVVHTGDPDEALADYTAPSWIETWDKANPVGDAGQ